MQAPHDKSQKPGSEQSEAPCPGCQGKGKAHGRTCPTCRGAGYLKRGGYQTK